MPDFYRLVKSNDPANGTTEVVLETDAGRPTKVVSTGIPVRLNADERKRVEALGFELDSVSKEEAETAEASGGFVVGDDTAAAAPLVGGATAASKDKDKDK